MTDQPDFLAQFSNALAARAEAAKSAVVAIRLAHERHITGMVWRSGIVVASEQSLPRRDEFELVAPGGAVVTAKIAGRDPSTNIAILRPARRSRRRRSLRARRAPAPSRLRSAPTEPAAPARGSGSSISPVPNGILAAAASSTGASCSMSGLPIARRAGRFSTPPAALFRHVDLRTARPGHCHSDRDHRARRAAARSRTAASRAAGSASPCRRSRCPMRCARPPTSPAA